MQSRHNREMVYKAGNEDTILALEDSFSPKPPQDCKKQPRLEMKTVIEKEDGKDVSYLCWQHAMAPKKRLSPREVDRIKRIARILKVPRNTLRIMGEPLYREIQPDKPRFEDYSIRRLWESTVGPVEKTLPQRHPGDEASHKNRQERTEALFRRNMQEFAERLEVRRNAIGDWKRKGFLSPYLKNGQIVFTWGDLDALRWQDGQRRLSEWEQNGKKTPRPTWGDTDRTSHPILRAMNRRQGARFLDRFLQEWYRWTVIPRFLGNIVDRLLSKGIASTTSRGRDAEIMQQLKVEGINATFCDVKSVREALAPQMKRALQAGMDIRGMKKALETGTGIIRNLPPKGNLKTKVELSIATCPPSWSGKELQGAEDIKQEVAEFAVDEFSRLKNAISAFESGEKVKSPQAYYCLWGNERVRGVLKIWFSNLPQRNTVARRVVFIAGPQWVKDFSAVDSLKLFGFFSH